jgi:DNA-binding CsgD family transcriptional regulator
MRPSPAFRCDPVAVRLSRSAQVHLHAAMQTFAEPLAYATRDAWLVAVMARARALCDGETSFVASPTARIGVADAPTGPHFLSHGADAIAAGLSARVRYVPPAPSDGAPTVRSGDAAWDDGMAAVRTHALGACTSTHADALIGRRVERSPIFHDLFAPHGGHSACFLTVTRPDDLVWLSVFTARPRYERFGSSTTAVLQLAVPALAAGLDAWARVHAGRDALAATLDRLPHGALLCALPGGRLLHRSPALEALLAADPERDRLATALDQVVRALGGLCAPAPARAEIPPDAPTRTVRTALAEYRVWGSVLPPGLVSACAAGLVALERTTPLLPTCAALRARFGLTAREAEVALHLATGARDEDVARDLGVSAHTVRHHAERIFQKLGIHSRKALGLTLLAAARADGADD